MLLQLIAALVLCGSVTSEHTNEPPNVSTEMSHEWQKITDENVFSHLSPYWREAGFEFKVPFDTNTWRAMLFYSDSQWFGSIEWDDTEIYIFGYNDSRTDKNGCNATGGTEYDSTGETLKFIDDVELDSPVGIHTTQFGGGMFTLQINDTVLFSMDVSRCAEWLGNPNINLLKMYDFAPSEDEYRYAKKLPSAEDCQRGEFWWREECHQCPPGKSTVREGDTDYNDCIDMRYISCRPEEEGMECERDICPCNAYEECNRDYNSAEYGICMMQSDYKNGGVSVTVSTGLLVLVTFLFNFME